MYRDNPRPVLAYAGAPPRAPHEDGLFHLPMTRAVRRAFVWRWTMPFIGIWAVEACLYGARQALVPGTPAIGHVALGVAFLMSCGVVVSLLSAYTSTLRPRTVEVTADRLIVTPRNGKPEWRVRSHARGVRVRPVRFCGFGVLDVLTRHGDSLVVLGYGRLEDLERLAVDLRLALGLPTPAGPKHPATGSFRP